MSLTDGQHQEGYFACACGAFRPGVIKKADGKVTWISGCRACDRIAYFKDGNQLRMNSEVTMDSEKLLARAQREEAEVERLRGGARAVLMDLLATNVDHRERVFAAQVQLKELLGL